MNHRHTPGTTLTLGCDVSIIQHPVERDVGGNGGCQKLTRELVSDTPEHLLDLGFSDTAGKGDGQSAAGMGKGADRCGIDPHG